MSLCTGIVNREVLGTSYKNKRIVRAIGGNFYVVAQDDVYRCTAKGIFRKEGLAPLVGDLVDFDVTHQGDLEGNITEIHERTSELQRPRVANVNQAVFVGAPKNPSLNLDMLDKFLVMAESQGIDVMIAINKAELGEEQELENLKLLYGGIGYMVVCVSAVTGQGMELLTAEMSGKISVMAGASGVGKSSIVNRLVLGANMRTGALSERIERGKHTTRHAELLQVSKDTYLVDSPGFSNLEQIELEADVLAHYFREFVQNIGNCRFRNCLHIDEPGCAIKSAVGVSISPERYERYKNMLRKL